MCARNKFESYLATNLTGLFYWTCEVVAEMILKRVKGVIVNASSIFASGNVGKTAYSASNAEMDALTVVVDMARKINQEIR